MKEGSSPSSWIQKFGYAFRGVKRGVRGESSFFVHFFVALCVVVAASLLHMTLVEWCLLVGCIASVLVAEMFNSSIEHLARAVTREEHPEIRDALDIASGAVLLAAFGAVVVGAILFLTRLASLLA